MSSNGSGLNRPRSGEVMLKAHRRAVTSAANPNDALAQHDRKRADELAAQVLQELPEGTTEIGVGGELAISRGAGTVLPFFNDTLSKPNLVSLDASNQRAELAGKADALEMALDASETIAAKNSIEKMLAHQLAAAHRSIMEMRSQLIERLGYIIPSESRSQSQSQNVEACRLASAIARQEAAFQQGVMLAQRLRLGGRQEVVVRHVQITQVGDGGQAVVAGAVASKRGAGGSRRRKGAGRKK